MLVDWKLGVYCIMYFIAASSVYSLSFFFPIILRSGMNFSYAKAQLLSSPPYVRSYQNGGSARSADCAIVVCRSCKPGNGLGFRQNSNSLGVRPHALRYWR
jgi:hypothetical protein